MTLKEKFINYVYCFMGSGMLTNTYDEDIANWNAEFCEKIVDDFAIDFAEWLDNKYYQGKNVNEYHRSIDEYREGKYFTAKDLLEMFKKEKGL